MANEKDCERESEVEPAVIDHHVFVEPEQVTMLIQLLRTYKLTLAWIAFMMTLLVVIQVTRTFV